MRLTLRLAASLVVSAALVVGFSSWYTVRSDREKLLGDLERRAAIVAETLGELVSPALADGDRKKLAKAIERFGRRDQLEGLALYELKSGEMIAGPGLAATPELERLAQDAVLAAAPAAVLEGSRHLYASPVRAGDAVVGALVLFHDASYIERRLRGVWTRNFWRLLVHALLVCLVSLWFVHWAIAAPIEQLSKWMRELRAGGAGAAPRPPALFESLALEAGRLGDSLAAARAAAEEEAQLRERAEALWTPDRLREHVKNKLEGRPLLVVANREPYMHVRRGGRVEVITPASGLVTGVEPILRACGGTWVAHGSGDADRETADENSRVAVPPEQPQYTLRRVWLEKEQEEGYYYGFANEGLWPLCHIAHTRPIFRAEDWRHYQEVNALFAKAVLEELEGGKDPCVLIQDYHFGLLPELIKRARPDARVALFWHIPWPNPEGFAICPWQKPLLEGMLGADLVGFHTQFHCNNFLETVDRTLECRIDRERFAVRRAGRATTVKPYPISIAPPPRPAAAAPDRAALLKALGIKAKFLAVGVDRLDYTKGIVERFQGIERFLEKCPRYRGEFVFVQIGAPSRTHIKRYRDFMTEVEAESDRINWKFKGDGGYKPIVMLAKHHSHAEIDPYYRAADLCLVTSLHDGMNLVAKEFVAAREDERGGLILSRFTGAARELRDALIVNPYDAEQVADAIRYGLEMDDEEQVRRMRAMRAGVREHNVYGWAANLVDALARIRLGEPARSA